MKSKSLFTIICLLLFVANDSFAQTPELITQEGHTSVIRSLAFSPNGNLLASGSEDNKIKIWDIQAGLELRTLAGDSAVITFLAFIDDETLVSSDDLGRIRIWNTRAGRERSKPAELGCDSCRLALALSYDRRTLAVAPEQQEITLWDTRTLDKKKQLVNPQVSTLSLTFDSRNELLAVGDENGRVAILNTLTEASPVVLKSDRPTKLLSMAFSGDGNYIVAGCADSQIRAWSVRTSQLVHQWKAHTGQINAITFLHSGQLITGSSDGEIKIWDFLNQKPISSFHEKKNVRALAVSLTRGDYFASGGNNSAVNVWSIKEGRVFEWRARTFSVTDIAFNATGNIVATAHSPSVRLWNLATGQHRTLKSVGGWIYSLAFSNDGKHLATSSESAKGGPYQVDIWNLESSSDSPAIHLKDKLAFALAFSPDGKRLATCNHAGDITVLATDTGNELWRWQTRSTSSYDNPIHFIAFASNDLLISGNPDGIIRFWEQKKSEPQKTIAANIGSILAIDVSANGKFLAARGNSKIKVWNLTDGKELPFLFEIGGVPSSIKLSSNGKYLSAGGYEFDTRGYLDAPVRVWEVATGKLMHVMLGHKHGITSVAFNHDGTRVVSSSWDNTWRVWDVQSGKELCNVIALDQTDWVAVTPEGRFDGSADGQTLIHWRVGKEVIRLEQLKEKYHEPGLLPKVLAYDKTPFLLDVKVFKDVKLYPKIELTAPAETTSVMTIKLTDRGGGIGPVKVYVNGAEQIVDARDPSFNPNKCPGTCELNLTVDLKRFDRFLQSNEDNDITVVAYSRDNLPSRGETISFKPMSYKEINPQLWAIFVGVSKYQQGERKDIKDLRFAAKDAWTIAQAFKIAGERLFPGRVHVTTLSTESEKPEEQPTKANIVKALKELTDNPKVTASDVLLFYVAGHGVSYGGAEGDYYFLTKNAFTANLKDEDIRNQTTISGREIEDWIIKIPTRKRVLILDTCAAGRFTEALDKPRAVDAVNQRAWERMQDRAGLWVLAGSAADANSYESNRYGQGILTYSLLRAIGNDWQRVLEVDQRSRQPELVDVARLFNYSADEVPKLASDNRGIQKPRVLNKRDARSFTIGRVTNVDRSDILRLVSHQKPVYLRSNFQLESRPSDPLNLTSKLDEQLWSLSERGIDAPLVFWDVPNHPGTYRISGRYTTAGASIKVTVFIFAIVQEGNKVEEKDFGMPFSIENVANADQLVTRILQEVEKRIPHPGL